MAPLRSTWKKVFKTVLLTSLAVTLPIGVTRELGVWEAAELTSYDDLLRRRPAEKPDDRIVVVTIGDEDIDAVGQYPIPDDKFAELLEKLESYQPKVIGLDIARDLPYGSKAGHEQLRAVIKQSSTIISGCLLSTNTHPGSPPAPGAQPEGLGFASFPEEKADATIRRVNLNGTPGQYAKTLRRNHTCNNYDAKNVLPSLSLLVAQDYLDKSGISADLDPGGNVRFKQAVLQRIDSRFGGYRHLDTHEDQIMLNYRGDRAFATLSMQEVLKDHGDRQASRVADKVVLIGSTSEVSKDFLSTPYLNTQVGYTKMHGVFVHANAVSQILGAVLDNRPLIRSWPELGEILWIWICALGGGFVAFYNRRMGLFILGTGAIALALWGLCYWVLLAQALWIPLVPAVWAATLTGLGVWLKQLADRTGYSNAILEQFSEQLRGLSARGTGQANYLENLVQRARLARQSQQATTLLDVASTPETDFSATPELQELYQQVTQQVRQDFEAERRTQEQAITQAIAPQLAHRRLQTLLSRAQTAHAQPASQPAPQPAPPRPALGPPISLPIAHAATPQAPLTQPTPNHS